MRATTEWDDVDRLVLSAARHPSTIRQIADATGLTPDMAQAQVEVYRDTGLLAQTVDAGVRFHLTLAGWKRLSALLTDQPRQQAAA